MEPLAPVDFCASNGTDELATGGTPAVLQAKMKQTETGATSERKVNLDICLIVQ